MRRLGRRPWRRLQIRRRVGEEGTKDVENADEVVVGEE